MNVDESLFDPRRVKGKRGRDGQVYTRSFPDCSKATLQAIICDRVYIASVINSDGWRGYNGLGDFGYGHYRVDHSKDEFARGRVHINGIEGLRALAKVRLAKFKGIPDQTFHLHLRECEWRYNNRFSDKVKLLLQ